MIQCSRVMCNLHVPRWLQDGLFGILRSTNRFSVIEQSYRTTAITVKRLAQILKLVIGRFTCTQLYNDELSRTEYHRMRHVLSILKYSSS